MLVIWAWLESVFFYCLLFVCFQAQLGDVLYRKDRVQVMRDFCHSENSKS